MKLTYLLGTSAILALSGCAGVGADSTLKYDGAANGSHSDTFDCDDEGTIEGSGDIADGQVTVTLRDSDGDQLFQQTYSDSFTLDTRTISGASGAWNLAAQRSGDDVLGDAFSGDYAIHVRC
jgi:hypothetical protein